MSNERNIRGGGVNGTIPVRQSSARRARKARNTGLEPQPPYDVSPHLRHERDEVSTMNGAQRLDFGVVSKGLQCR